jgi:phosphoribosylaminoimidazolecarboxamide formyltransferase / IMP cyclohydrolase
LRALFSLFDTSCALGFAQSMQEMGWEIIATQETGSILFENGIPFIGIESYTGVLEDYGFPPTLHPKVESALTGDNPDIKIDLVFDIPYPLQNGFDVGGPTLLALAIKGNRIPVLSNGDMSQVVKKLKMHGQIDDHFKKYLLTKASVFLAQHYIRMLEQKQKTGDGLVGINVLELMEGENPYQVPSHLFSECGNNDPLSLSKFENLGGTAPCFTNLADLDSIVHAISVAHEAFKAQFKKSPFLVLAAKHGNACGFGADWEAPEIAISKALFGNPGAIWGGEVICNFPVTEDLAKLLFESNSRKDILGKEWWMLDVIAAPSFSPGAVEVLSRKKGRKLLVNKSLANAQTFSSQWQYRQVRGGFLRQPAASYILSFDEVEFDRALFSDDELGALIMAWAVSWNSSLGGNEISLVKDLQLIGSGGGPATTIAAQNALLRAREQGHSTRSAFFAADAFFPFTDAPETLIKAGCKGGLVPKGGKFEANVRELFLENQINMVFLPEKFRGFCRH